MRRILIYGWISALCVVGLSTSLLAQGANSISGHVFGDQRLPLEGITVELLDDFSRTVERIRTNSSGRYFFTRMPAGRYRVRVMPFGTRYGEQEVELEIQNLLRDRGDGVRVVSAFANEQRDFYLRIERDERSHSSETVFAQEVPPEAEKLYNDALERFEKKDLNAGYEKLKSAIEVFPEYYLAIERLGVEYVRAKYYRAASVLLQSAVNLNPRSFESWYGLAYSFYALNLRSEALEASQKAIDMNPTSINGLLLTGTLLRLTSSFDESEKLLVKAKKLAMNKEPDIHWQLALLYGNSLKRYKDAADELEIFLKLQPNSKDANRIKALIKDFRQKSQRS